MMEQVTVCSYNSKRQTYRSRCGPVDLNLHHFSFDDLRLLSVQTHAHAQRAYNRGPISHTLTPGKRSVSAGPLT